MTKVKVLKEFRDRNSFSKVYKVGSVVEFEDSRAEKLVQRGLVEVTTEAVTTETKTATAAAKAKSATTTKTKTATAK